MAPHDFWTLKRVIPINKHIDIAATMAAYGYDANDIPPLCDRPVVIACEICNTSKVVLMAWATKKGVSTCGAVCAAQKGSKTLMGRYGVSSTLQLALQPGRKRKVPSSERIIGNILKNHYKIPFQHEHVIGQYSFDFYVPSCDLLIEVQGDFFHKFKENGYSGTSRDKAKTTYIEKYTTHKLIWIWEHELHVGRIRKILDYHILRAQEPLISVVLRKLVFRPISHQEAFGFLSMYHYLGNLGTAASPYGAFYGGVLVCVAVFGGITRVRSAMKTAEQLNITLTTPQVRELRRFCIRPNAEAENLGSYCMSRLLKMFRADNPNNKAVISFSDPGVGDSGGLYKACGYVEAGVSSDSYHYLDPKTLKPIHKRTVYALAQNVHMKERPFVEAAGLIKVPEVPKIKWVHLRGK